MVHEIQGGGKFSSPHLVKDFREKNPPKMERCDLDWIIIFLVTYLDAFLEENLEESTHGTVFYRQDLVWKNRV